MVSLGDGAGPGDPGEEVRAAQAGDARAFERIFARFRGPLTAYATALLRDRGHAEDAVQEAFVHAFRNLRRLRRPGSLRPWLYAILENRALSAWRHRRRRRTYLLGDGHSVADGTPPFPAEGDDGDAPPPPPSQRAVRAALEAMPEGYRDALSRHYVEGQSTRQLARALGLTLNNAKVRLFRARNALRRELRARGVEGPPPRRPPAEVQP